MSDRRMRPGRKKHMNESLRERRAAARKTEQANKPRMKGPGAREQARALKKMEE